MDEITIQDSLPERVIRDLQKEFDLSDSEVDRLRHSVIGPRNPIGVVIAYLDQQTDLNIRLLELITAISARDMDKAAEKVGQSAELLTRLNRLSSLAFVSLGESLGEEAKRIVDERGES